MIKKIFAKWKSKRRQSNIDISGNSQRVIITCQIPRKGELIQTIQNSNQFFSFTIFWTWYGVNSSPERFLDEDNIEEKLCLENCVNNQVIFMNILWKDFNVLNNYKSLLFTDE